MFWFLGENYFSIVFLILFLQWITRTDRRNTCHLSSVETGCVKGLLIWLGNEMIFLFLFWFLLFSTHERWLFLLEWFTGGFNLLVENPFSYHWFFDKTFLVFEGGAISTKNFIVLWLLQIDFFFSNIKIDFRKWEFVCHNLRKTLYEQSLNIFPEKGKSVKSRISFNKTDSLKTTKRKAKYMWSIIIEL